MVHGWYCYVATGILPVDSRSSSFSFSFQHSGLNNCIVYSFQGLLFQDIPSVCSPENSLPKNRETWTATWNLQAGAAVEMETPDLTKLQGTPRGCPWPLPQVASHPNNAAAGQKLRPTCNAWTAKGISSIWCQTRLIQCCSLFEFSFRKTRFENIRPEQKSRKNVFGCFFFNAGHR